MSWLVDAWAAIEDFLDVGGNVLLLILATTFAFWTLIIERYWYFRTGHPEEVERVVSLWQARGERQSWHAHQIRRALISRVSLKLNRSLGLIQTLVALCPLLGLLGTVTGMIEVFEVMAMLGSGNPRAMASGVSRATIPTMAGMVAAISGLYFSVTLQKVAQREVERTADLLTTE